MQRRGVRRRAMVPRWASEDGDGGGTDMTLTSSIEPPINRQPDNRQQSCIDAIVKQYAGRRLTSVLL